MNSGGVDEGRRRVALGRCPKRLRSYPPTMTDSQTLGHLIGHIKKIEVFIGLLLGLHCGGAGTRVPALKEFSCRAWAWRLMP